MPRRIDERRGGAREAYRIVDHLPRRAERAPEDEARERLLLAGADLRHGRGHGEQGGEAGGVDEHRGEGGVVVLDAKDGEDGPQKVAKAGAREDGRRGLGLMTAGVRR
jgi:hypothetical protein